MYERLGIGTRLLGHAVFPILASGASLGYHDFAWWLDVTEGAPYLKTATFQELCGAEEALCTGAVTL